MPKVPFDNELWCQMRRGVVAMRKFIVEPGVLAVTFQQALVGAVLNNATVIQYQHLMSSNNGA